MSSPEVLDFAALLAPLPGASPVGVDLRRDAAPTSPYYAIRDARKVAREEEKRQEEGDSTARPEWRPVLQAGQQALAEKTKDLEVAAYLIEALLRLHGFAGLRDGLRLARELVERYWDEGLYPEADEDGVASRIWALVGLTGGEEREGTLLAPILRVPLTEPGRAGPYSLGDYRGALDLEKVSDSAARQSRLERGGVTLDAVERAFAESTAAFVQNLVEDLNECLDQFGQLDAALASRCGTDAPATFEVRGAIESCLDTIRGLAGHKLETAEVAAPAEDDSPPPTAAAPATAGNAGPLRTREDALRALLNVAEFFRRTEPHTVLSFALEQVVRWGRMPLPELLTELIPEESARLALFKQVGIKPPAEMMQE